jgi:hypothetical protein
MITRVLSTADYLRLSELQDANDILHAEFVGKASEAFYSQPCSNGELDWRHGYGGVYDQEAETVDGYANDLGWIDWPHIRIAVLIVLGIFVAFGLVFS